MDTLYILIAAAIGYVVFITMYKPPENIAFLDTKTSNYVATQLQSNSTRNPNPPDTVKRTLLQIIQPIEYTKEAVKGYDELVNICTRFNELYSKQNITPNEVTSLQDLQKEANYIFQSLLMDTGSYDEHHVLIQEVRDHLLDEMYAMVSMLHRYAVWETINV